MKTVEVKKIILVMDDGEKLELDVDDADFLIVNGVDTDYSNHATPEMKDNGIRHITISAWKGSPDYIDSHTKGFRTTMNRRPRKNMTEFTRASGNFIYTSGNYVGTFKPIPIVGKWLGIYRLVWEYYD